MRSLLDINVLIALMDADHSFHERAHAWWSEENPAWASCPLTENGLVRIMSAATYSKIQRFRAVALIAQFQTFVANTKHAFWSDAISLRDGARFDHNRILSPGHLTDFYLLALAVENGGRLVTFDRAIPLAAVRGAAAEHLLVLG